MHVALLGPLEVEADGKLVRLQASKERGVLAILALRNGSSVATDELIGALWGEGAPKTARKAVQIYVAKLRQVLPPGSVTTTDSGYSLQVEDVDAVRFEELLHRSRSLASADNGAAAVDLLVDALALWRGPPLADLADHHVGAVEIARLEELRRTAEEELVDLRLTAGEHETLVARLEAAVAAEPLRERRWAQLMLALYRCGRQSEALRAYQRLRRHLGDELGIEPDDDLAALENAMLARKPELRWTPHGPMAPGTPPPGSESPARRLVDARGRSSNLPGSLSSFIGREAEIAQVLAMVEAFRVVTLTGAGGVGKTRLAVEVARAAARRWEDGVWLVELAGMNSAHGVGRAAATVLGVREQAGQPAVAAVVEALWDRDLLLVLDNCEHVLTACAELAEAVGHRCPRVCLLATSREPLGIDGERIFRVPSLSLPDPGVDSVEGLAAFDAVNLFVERAQAQHQSFGLDRSNAALVASICRRLDGIPLGLELAAAQLRSMPIGEVGRRLDDRFELASFSRRTAIPRHRTLQATVEWSYNLLSARERTVLGRLSVFVGGWDLEAVGPVCARGAPDPAEAVDVVGSLVDKSLVQAELLGDNVRYCLLETVRQFAANELHRLGDSEVHAAREAHAATYLALAESAAPQLVGAEQTRWLARLDREHDNLQTAAAYFVAHPAAADEALRFGVALMRFWYSRGYYREGVETLQGALDKPGGEQPTIIRAAALKVIACLHLQSGEWSVARARYEESLGIARSHDDYGLLSEILVGLSQCRRDDSQAALALADEAVTAAYRAGGANQIGVALAVRALADFRHGGQSPDNDFSEALSHFRRARNRQMLAATLANWTIFELAAGKLADARAHLDAAFSIAVDTGDEGLLPWILSGLGQEARMRGDHAAARQRLGEALRLARRNGDHALIGEVITELAVCAGMSGDLAAAARLHGAAAAHWERLGECPQTDIVDSQFDQAHVSHVLGQKQYEEAWQEGQNLPIRDIIDLALREV